MSRCKHGRWKIIEDRPRSLTQLVTPSVIVEQCSDCGKERRKLREYKRTHDLLAHLRATGLSRQAGGQG